MRPASPDGGDTKGSQLAAKSLLKAKQQKRSTGPSRVVPHRSTTPARTSLTSLFGWEAVSLVDMAALMDMIVIFTLKTNQAEHSKHLIDGSASRAGNIGATVKAAKSERRPLFPPTRSFAKTRASQDDAVAASTVVPEKCSRSARTRCSTSACALLPPQHGRAIATTTAADAQRHEQNESIVWDARLSAGRAAGRGDREASRRQRKAAAGRVERVGAGGGNPLRRPVRVAAALDRAALPERCRVASSCAPRARRRKFWILLSIVGTLHAINTYRDQQRAVEQDLPPGACRPYPGPNPIGLALGLPLALALTLALALALGALRRLPGGKLLMADGSTQKEEEGSEHAHRLHQLKAIPEPKPNTKPNPTPNPNPYPTPAPYPNPNPNPNRMWARASSRSIACGATSRSPFDGPSSGWGLRRKGASHPEKDVLKYGITLQFLAVFNRIWRPYPSRHHGAKLRARDRARTRRGNSARPALGA